jgi:Flp pilus assembly protein TadG
MTMRNRRLIWFGRHMADDRVWRSGTAATEFAIALPILMLLAFAATDFGRVPHFHQVVANAARTGAETGATHQFTSFSRTAWEAGIEEAVLREMQNIPNFDQSRMEFELTATPNADGLARIVVSVSYPFTTLIAWPGVPEEVQLHKRSEVLQFR